MDKELCQLVKDQRACFAQGVGKASNWNDYLRIHEELKQKVRVKRKVYKEKFMANINSS